MEHEDEFKTPRGRNVFAVRYILSGLLFSSCFLVYAMRLNLSVSITAMVNQTNPEIYPLANESCRSPDLPINGSSGTPERKVQGTFAWDQNDQALVTEAFFIGYLFSQIPGGYLAERFSSTWVLGLGVGLTAFFTCLTELAAKTNFYAFVVLRVLEGLGEGVVYPAVFVFTSNWIPVSEQSFLLNVILSGSVIGTVVTMPVSAILCNSIWGWPASFYIFGILGLVWSLVWMFYAADGPEDHKYISNEEREYILENRPLSTGEKNRKVPWSKMLLSPAVLLLGLVKLGGSLNVYLILTQLPSYLNYMYGLEIVNDGYVNGGMNLGLASSVVGTGFLVDKIITKKPDWKNFTRKSFVFCSTIVPSLCLCLIAFIGCNSSAMLALIFVNCVFLGCTGGGDTSISLDLAPKYAGTVQGVVNLMGNVAGVLAPKLVGILTQESNTLRQWNLVFVYTAIFTMACSIIFLIFGSTKEQRWGSEDN